MRVGARARAVIAVALVTAAAPARADDALTLAFVGDVMFGRYVPGGLAPGEHTIEATEVLRVSYLPFHSRTTFVRTVTIG